MTLDNINRWLTLVGNLAVVGGLILVAAQIQQNTEITRAQVANDYYLADMNLELAMMGSNPADAWVKAVYTPDELTPTDAAVLDRYFNYGVVQLQRLKRMHELGLADEEWENRVDYLRWHLGNEVGRRWWAFARDGFSPEIANRVDGMLEADRNRNVLDGLINRGPKAPAETPPLP